MLSYNIIGEYNYNIYNMDIMNINIVLDSSVKHLTKTAAMAISGSLENGLLFSGTDRNLITIYKDRIDFGKSINPELEGIVGNFFPNFYREYGKIVYRFGSGYKCSMFTKTLDYVGIMAPTVPDNTVLFNLIYPRFA